MSSCLLMSCLGLVLSRPCLIFSFFVSGLASSWGSCGTMFGRLGGRLGGRFEPFGVVLKCLGSVLQAFS